MAEAGGNSLFRPAQGGQGHRPEGKGGTTEAALAVLTERCVTEAIADAVVAARDRGRDLGS